MKTVLEKLQAWEYKLPMLPEGLLDVKSMGELRLAYDEALEAVLRTLKADLEEEMKVSDSPKKDMLWRTVCSRVVNTPGNMNGERWTFMGLCNLIEEYTYYSGLIRIIPEVS